MSKPSEEELDTALKMAAQMRDKDSDPFFIAKSLLSHNYRMKYLEELMQAADRYINHGMADQEKTRLLRTIEKVKDAESFTANRERDSFGLE
jgi:predicted transcriptional regulator